MWDFSPTPDKLIGFLTLSAMEIVLGIDNVIFLTLLVGKLPPEKQPFARRLGLGLALVTRLGLLFTLSVMMRLVNPLFSVFGKGFSGRDLILLGGGLFLMGKAVFEIHEKLESKPTSRTVGAGAKALGWILVQVAILDIVFSLDSVITAVGMAQNMPVIIAAMIIAVAVMLFFAGPIGRFVDRHPTIKILALSFLLLIGFMLVAEGVGQHVPKGYIYFAMAFSLGIEVLNMKIRKQQQPVHLHEPPVEGEKAES